MTSQHTVKPQEIDNFDILYLVINSKVLIKLLACIFTNTYAKQTLKARRTSLIRFDTPQNQILRKKIYCPFTCTYWKSPLHSVLIVLMLAYKWLCKFHSFTKFRVNNCRYSRVNWAQQTVGRTERQTVKQTDRPGIDFYKVFIHNLKNSTIKNKGSNKNLLEVNRTNNS